MATITKIAGETFNGESLSQKQMSAIEMSMSMGNSYPQEIMDVYNKQKNGQAAKPATPTQDDIDKELDELLGLADSGLVPDALSSLVKENVGEVYGDAAKAKEEKKKGGSCSSDSSSSQESSSDTPIIDLFKQIFSKTPDQKKVALDIVDNDIPENWWDRLPDFDPRVYDAISMEQAAACVNYIFDELPDIYELENQIESRKFRKICPRLKTQVPRTKIAEPEEIKYDTQIDSFVNKDESY